MLENEVKAKNGDQAEDLDTLQRRRMPIARLKKRSEFLKDRRADLAGRPRRGNNLSPISSFNTRGSSENSNTSVTVPMQKTIQILQLNSALLSVPARLVTLPVRQYYEKNLRKLSVISRIRRMAN